MVPLFSRFRSRLTAMFAGFAGAALTNAQSDSVSSKPKSGGEEKGPRFAFVCLNSDADPQPEALKSKLAQWLMLSSEDQVSKLETERKEGATVTSFEVDSRNVLIARAGFPIPKADIDYAAANALFWPEAAEKLNAHKSHLIVTVFGKFKDPIDEGLFLSRVIAACTEVHETAGVYWGHATVAHSPEFFLEQIKPASRDNLPVLAWVGFLRAQGKEEGTFDLYTRGLNSFGVMEMEVIGSKQKPSAVMEMVANLASYLLKNGNVIQDGHTIGSSETEKIRTKHAKSVLDREGKVLRIEF